MKLQGLKLDNVFSDAPLNTWSYAKNILVSNGYTSVENEKGTTVHYVLAQNEVLIRAIATPIDHILFIYNTVTTTGSIRIVNSDKTGTEIFSSQYWNISEYDISTNQYRFIDVVYLYNSLGNLVLAWTDNILPPFIFDTTVPQLNITKSNLEKYYLFPHFTHPNYYLSKIIGDGNLLTGCYYVSSCYEIEDNVNSSFGIISNPIYIVKENTSSFTGAIGSDVKIPSDKSFIIELSNIDTRYTYIKLGVIYQTSTSIESAVTKRYKITGHEMQFIISDFNELEPITLNDIVISSPAFEKVGTISISNKRLRLGNLTKFDKLTTAQVYDTFVKELSLNWLCVDEVELEKLEGSYKDTCFIFNNKGFKYDEVYAFYAGLKLKTGGYYGVYHIPGRVAEGTEVTDYFSIDDGTENETQELNHKVNSTASLISNLSGITFGKMGYWQNDNESYNGLYGTVLGSDNIRHHRFPSLKQIAEWKNGIINVNTITSQTIISNSKCDVKTLVSGRYYPHFDFDAPLPSGVTFTKGSGSTPDKFTVVANQSISFTKTLQIRMQSSLARHSVATGVFDLTFQGNSILKNGGLSFIAEDEVEEGTGNIVAVTEQLPIDGNLIGQSASSDILIVFNFAITNGSILAFKLDGNIGFSSNSVIEQSTAKQYILGVKLDINYTNILANCPSILDLCDGIELFYAKRTLENSIIIDQSLTLNNTDLNTNISYTRFYGFDSITNLLNLNPTHIRAQLQYLNSNMLTKLSSGLTKLQTVKCSKIKSITYLPTNNSATTPNNQGKENCYAIQSTSGNFDNCLSELLSLKNDVYLDFTQQTLVSCGKIVNLVETKIIPKYKSDTIMTLNVTQTESDVTNNYIRINGIISEWNGAKIGDLILLNNWLNMSSSLYTNLNNKIYKIISKIDGELICSGAYGINLYTDPVRSYPNSPNATISIIPFFYGGDTFISNNSIITYGTSSSYLNNSQIESISGSEGLITVTLKSDISFDLTSFGAGDTIIVKNASDGFTGTFKIASIDSNIKFTYAASGKGSSSIDTVIIYYYPVSLLYFPIHSISNIGFREVGKNQYEKFYPNVNLLETETINSINRYKYISAMKEADIANYNIYNSTWHLLNQFRQDTIDGQISTYQQFYPNRIYSTTEKPESSISTYWRKIRSLDFVDIPNDRGGIIRIIGHDKILYIRTQYGLKRGVTNDILRTTDIDISLKTTDIFDNGVQDVFDAPDQYIQALNSLDTLFTPYGLVVVDVNSGDVYIITNELKVISKINIESWFRANTKKLRYDFSTNAKGKGVILGYDDITKRIFVTIRSNIAVTSITESASSPTTNIVIVTVTTTYNHNLVTDDFVTLSNCNISDCNGRFQITVLDNTRFTYNYVKSGVSSSSVTGGILVYGDFTLSFNVETQYWVCFHDYLPDQYVPNNNGLFYTKDNVIYKLGNGEFGKFQGNYYDSVIDFIFNSDNEESFLINSIKWVSNIEQNLVNYWNETISKIAIFNKNQNTGEIEISKKETMYVANVLTQTGNTQFNKGEWSFNDVKDAVLVNNSNTKMLNSDFTINKSVLETSSNPKDFWTRSKLIAKGFIVRLIFTNSVLNKKIRISNIGANIKKTL